MKPKTFWLILIIIWALLMVGMVLLKYLMPDNCLGTGCWGDWSLPK